MSNSRQIHAAPVGYDLKLRNALERSVAAINGNLPTPAQDWRACAEVVVAALVGSESPASPGPLRQLRDTFFAAPGREAEMGGLWNASLATAAFAAAFASLRGVTAEDAAVAGLLHRCGEVAARRALALSESASGVELDAPARSRIAALHASAFTEELARGWRLAPAVALAVCGWNRIGEYPADGCSTAVYLGELLAHELLRPHAGAPGALESAAEELCVRAADLEALRGCGAAALALIARFGGS